VLDVGRVLDDPSRTAQPPLSWRRGATLSRDRGEGPGRSRTSTRLVKPLPGDRGQRPTRS
jgi:hypothetical protein